MASAPRGLLRVDVEYRAGGVVSGGVDVEDRAGGVVSGASEC